MALSRITTESILDGEITTAKFATNVGGKVVQIVNVMDGAVATGTTTINYDTGIPQKTEGNEYMSLAITPTSATNKLLIMANGLVTSAQTASNNVYMFLVQDDTANSLKAVGQNHAYGQSCESMSLTHYMTAGTTSATTFKIRAGGDSAGTTTFNGASGALRFGGVGTSQITIMEILA